MMRDALRIAFLSLRRLGGLNAMRYGKEKHAKKRAILLGFFLLLLLLFLFAYVGSLTAALCLFGLGDSVPLLLSTLSLLLVFLFGIMMAGGILFSKNGFEFLSALPIRPSSILLGRLLLLYFEDVLFTAAVFLPGGIVYAALGGGVGKTALLFLSIPFLPMLPMMLSVWIGVCVQGIAARVRRQSLAVSVLTVGFVLAVLLIPQFLGDRAPISIDAVLPMLESALADLSVLLPPVYLLSLSLSGEIFAFAALIFLSLAICGVSVLLLSRVYAWLMCRTMMTQTGQKKEIRTRKRKNIGKALLIREARRYVASSVYVTNTIIGPILALAMAIALSVIGREGSGEQLPLPIELLRLLPFLFAATSVMMPPCAVALSMEGRQIGYLKSLPIPAFTLFGAKIGLTLLICLPFWAISVPFVLVRLTKTFSDALFYLILTPLLMAFFATAAFGMDLLFRKFDRESEMATVKQSLPTLLGGFLGPFGACLLGAPVLLLPPALALAYQGGLSVLLVIGIGCLLRRYAKVELSKL